MPQDNQLMMRYRASLQSIVALKYGAFFNNAAI